MTRRDYRMDNLRCLLIFLVVFCHLLVEVSAGKLTGMLYQVIYVFHMPAFVFVTGYFARFRPSRIAWGLAAPYALFQTLATARRNLVAGRAWAAGLTYSYPQWTLWYLLACVLWYLTIPALERVTAWCGRLAIVAGAFVASLAVGFVPQIGAWLDFSRVVVLYPFFCAGFYAGKARLSWHVGQRCGRSWKVGLGVLVLACMVAHYAHGACPKEVLYRDTPYASLWDLEARALIQVTASAWCAFLLVVVPGRELGIVSMVGRNTMSVYLLHPWIIRLLRLAPPVGGGEPTQLVTCVLLAAAMLAVLGNDVVGHAFRYVFGGGWLARWQRRT